MHDMFPAARRFFSSELAIKYYGAKTDAEVRGFMSQTESWVPFPHDSVKSKKDVENSPYPNLYISHNTDDGLYYVGITFNNYSALNWILALESTSNIKIRDIVENKVKKLPDEYNWVLSSRTRIGYKTTFEYGDGKGKSSELDVPSTISLIKSKAAEYRKVAGTLTSDGKKIAWKAPAFDIAYTSGKTIDDLDIPFNTLFGILLSFFEAKVGKKLDIADRERDTLKQRIIAYKACTRDRSYPETLRAKYENKMKASIEEWNQKYPGVSLEE